MNRLSGVWLICKLKKVLIFSDRRNILAMPVVRGIMLSMSALKVLLAVLFLTVRLEAVAFKDDDMVVLLGNTVIERSQHYGHVEAALTLAGEKKNVKFRNLGWSGDSVFGHARSYFGPPKEGFRRLQADIAGLKPDVVILCYGAVAAFEGEQGLSEFIQGYERLIDMISNAASPREIVLVSPPPAETLTSPMPDMTEHNEHLAIYAKAIGELAHKKQLQFADLFKAIGTGKSGMTDNGLHFTNEGYRMITPKLIQALGMKFPSDHALKSETGEKLREVVVKKNRLFFHRWRPANETYLRLFRKHEQGQNVKELPMFDPLIAEQEKEIESLRQSLVTKK